MLARHPAGALFVAALALTPALGEGASWADVPPSAPATPAPSASGSPASSSPVVAPPPAAPPSAAPPPAVPPPAAPPPSAPPPAAPPPVAPPPAAPPAPPPGASASPIALAPATTGKGAIIVAVTNDAAAAARALARDTYREASLRPSLDEFTAKLLTGDPDATAKATGKLKELAEIRAAIPGAGSESASRHLLASLGSELGAAFVVAVQLDGGRPSARALRTASASYEGAPFTGTARTLEYGSVVYTWPGATTTLLALFPSAVPLTPGTGGPLAPLRTPGKDSTKDTPFWASAWFWGTVGGVVAVGVTVFVLSKTTSNGGTVHIDGTVGP